MSAVPSVSVAITVYNGHGVLTPCVETLAAQDRPPDEIVVIDDGSTDATPAELADLDARFPGLLRVHSQENRGAAAGLNRAISLATGDYVAIADADDVFPAHRLSTSVELAVRTDADMIGGQVVGGLGRRLRLAPSRFPIDDAGTAGRIARGFDPLPHATMMIRSSAVERFGGYRPLRRAEDLELMLRWAHRGARLAVSPEVLAWYRLRRQHLSVDTQTRWMLSTRYARDIATLADADVPEFGRWFVAQSLAPARREARRRVVRLAARLALGTLGLGGGDRRLANELAAAAVPCR